MPQGGGGGGGQSSWSEPSNLHGGDGGDAGGDGHATLRSMLKLVFVLSARNCVSATIISC